MHDSVILLLSPGSSEGFALLCKLELFCYLNLTGATKFKYERKSEKNSGRNSKMTPSCKCLLTGRKQYIRLLHISTNAPYLPPKILHNLCCSFLLGITAIPREIKTMLMQNLGEQIRCVLGDVQVANTLMRKKSCMHDEPKQILLFHSYGRK